MPIKPIDDTSWSGIAQVQAEAYSQVEPENLDVLKSKWLRSPESCFVYEKAGKVVGYLLAHSWNSETPPKLFQALPVGTGGAIIFLHDLAILREVSGEGIGGKMVVHLLQIAKEQGFQQIRLVSVQDSLGFWQKQGFSPIKHQEICSSYGEDAQLMSQRVIDADRYAMADN
ncbi:GNAT family N-acetyltransferase [Rheinheimera sp. NSM]|uniref:GNAT family N-acetyltransferase n=1 Tax=Rheinheimera sp. NSM TaxID=3457884 RepID=UPI0040354D97